MLATTQSTYILAGLFVLLLALQALWTLFMSYPIGFERKLKKGKSWVYIPLRWQGGYKMQVMLVSRLLMVLAIAGGVILLGHLTRRVSAPWLAGFGVFAGLLVIRVNALWLRLRYKQQEDAYYFLHDELRAKLEAEGKDMADSAFKSLAAYQHQNLLRKADEQGRLIQTLRSQSRKSRSARKQVKAQEPVET